jgi:hypothetical protein
MVTTYADWRADEASIDIDFRLYKHRLSISGHPIWRNIAEYARVEIAP